MNTFPNDPVPQGEDHDMTDVGIGAIPHTRGFGMQASFGSSSQGGGSSNTSGPGASTVTPSTNQMDGAEAWFGELDLSRFDKDVIRPAPSNLPKLDSDNWRDWSDNVYWFLLSRRVWGIVDGSIPRPTTRTEGLVWQTYAAFINHFFRTHATESQKTYIPVGRDVTPKMIWDKWSKVHVNKSSHRMGDLIERIWSYKAKQGEGVDRVAAELGN